MEERYGNDEKEKQLYSEIVEEVAIERGYTVEVRDDEFIIWYIENDSRIDVVRINKSFIETSKGTWEFWEECVVYSKIIKALKNKKAEKK